jgi:D-glycero-alpha-D-manno-heptose 1-phosphate guanylyltransferase
MKAIILAGGKGTRLRRVIRDNPKPMAPIAGRPFLEYLILQLLKWKIDEIVLSVGYKREIIKSYFGKGERWKAKIVYSEEQEPLGTGGAIKETAALLDDEHFIVMNGDSFFDVDFERLLSFHKDKHAIATMGLVHVDDTSRYGRVEMDAAGSVINFIEKISGAEGLINSGIYIVSREVIKCIPPGECSFESDILPGFVKNGLYGLTGKGFFIDIGVPRDYLFLSNNPRKLYEAVNL